MKSPLAKKASITLPAKLDQALRKRARREQRSLSGILQEAARFYISIKEFEELQRDLNLKAAKLDIRTEEDVDQMIHDLRSERK